MVVFVAGLPIHKHPTNGNKNMNGMHSLSGQWLDGLAHLEQSIRDILTTPIGTRVMRRDYGSRLPELVDAPVNRATIIDIYTATAEALLKWEPQLQLTRVMMEEASQGRLSLRLEGIFRPEQQTVTLAGISV